MIFGVSEGSSMACLFAATYPERTRALVIWGGQARWVKTKDYPWGVTPEQVERELAEISDGGMAAVEEAKLHLLIGPHVADQRGAPRLPLRPALGKAVLDDPLAEGLRHHRPGILETDGAGDRGTIGVRRGGDDAVGVDEDATSVARTCVMT